MQTFINIWRVEPRIMHHCQAPLLCVNRNGNLSPSIKPPWHTLQPTLHVQLQTVMGPTHCRSHAAVWSSSKKSSSIPMKQAFKILLCHQIARSARGFYHPQEQAITTVSSLWRGSCSSGAEALRMLMNTTTTLCTSIGLSPKVVSLNVFPLNVGSHLDLKVDPTWSLKICSKVWLTGSSLKK